MTVTRLNSRPSVLWVLQERSSQAASYTCAPWLSNACAATGATALLQRERSVAVVAQLRSVAVVGKALLVRVEFDVVLLHGVESLERQVPLPVKGNPT
jgi:hypothetical protein